MTLTFSYMNIKKSWLPSSFNPLVSTRPPTSQLQILFSKDRVSCSAGCLGIHYMMLLSPIPISAGITDVQPHAWCIQG